MDSETTTKFMFHLLYIYIEKMKHEFCIENIEKMKNFISLSSLYQFVTAGNNVAVVTLSTF